jgi:hypothetical protein
MLRNQQAANQKIHLLWFGCGSGDDFYPAPFLLQIPRRRPDQNTPSSEAPESPPGSTAITSAEPFNASTASKVAPVSCTTCIWFKVPASCTTSFSFSPTRPPKSFSVGRRSFEQSKRPNPESSSLPPISSPQAQRQTESSSYGRSSISSSQTAMTKRSNEPSLTVLPVNPATVSTKPPPPDAAPEFPLTRKPPSHPTSVLIGKSFDHGVALRLPGSQEPSSTPP